MKKADCDGTRLITDVVGIEKWWMSNVGTPKILATDKDVGKMWFLILGHDSSAMSWSYTSLACFTCSCCYMPNSNIQYNISLGYS